MDNTIEDIRKYLRENPTHTGANIARKFKIRVDVANNYYDYCKMLDDPEADMPIYNIVNYSEYRRKQLERETKVEIADRRKRGDRNCQLTNNGLNRIGTVL